MVVAFKCTSFPTLNKPSHWGVHAGLAPMTTLTSNMTSCHDNQMWKLTLSKPNSNSLELTDTPLSAQNPSTSIMTSTFRVWTTCLDRPAQRTMSLQIPPSTTFTTPHVVHSSTRAGQDHNVQKLNQSQSEVYQSAMNQLQHDMAALTPVIFLLDLDIHTRSIPSLCCRRNPQSTTINLPQVHATGSGKV
ncbi:uncharacterized protein UBRO_20640 [Ustilago bromivora]|uniref:Uncharacterized protein n=1 Tax=Ustilago bromivora TaxID=307758 RepID=A0A1K0H3Z3_9BASI|nr:uncharacterized protein UBRO_20640 [Ustilago bromivora]